MPNIKRMAEVSPTILFEFDDMNPEIRKMIEVFYKAFINQLTEELGKREEVTPEPSVEKPAPIEAAEVRVARAPTQPVGEEAIVPTAGARDFIDEIMSKVTLTGEHAQAIRASLEKEARSLYETLGGIAISGVQKKQVILVYDIGLEPATNAAARAGEATVQRYLGASLVEVRGTGRQLLDGTRRAIEILEKETGRKLTPNVDYVVVTIAGDATLDTNVLNANEQRELGRIINVENTDDRYVPVIGLYDLAIRIAYDQDSETLAQFLRRIGFTKDGNPFTPEEVAEALRRGLIRIRLPAIRPISMSEAVEAYKAVQQVLTAL